MTKILIATPLVGNTCVYRYAITLFQLARAFQAARPDVELAGPFIITSAHVSRARNGYASIVLEDPSISHLLFVDGDMGFGPQLLANMLDFDQPFVGTIYPQRPPGKAFVGADQILPGATVKGFARARRVGTGILLLKREVFERMADVYPELIIPADQKYRNSGVRERAFQCFESIIAEGMYLSEDLSFAHRWTEGCGGEIWANVDQPILHSGLADNEASYLSTLRERTG